MADWSTPTLADTWANFTSFLKNRDVDLAQALDPAVATVTNPPTNAIRWNSANKFWEKFNGTSWAALSASYLIQVGAFTGQVTKPEGTSALTIADNAVDDTKLRDSAALSVIGRAVNSSGNPADIAAAADDRLLTRVAGVLAWTQLNAGMVPANLIDNTKLADVATQTFKGRNTAATGDPEDLAIATAKTMLGLIGTSIGFATGVRALFQQTAAPTGWTKEVAAAFNDAGMRVTTGTVGTGGADAFNTLFGTGKSTATDGSGASGGYTLTTTDIPAHKHFIAANDISGTSLDATTQPTVEGTGTGSYNLKGNTTAATFGLTSSTGGGGSHNHSTPAHAHVLNSMNLKFVDCIVAAKD